MRLHVLSGDHAGARRVYKACVDVLQRELGVEPARATLDAYRVARREAAEPQPARLPLVGRRRDWALMREFFQAGSSGTRLLLIIGEASVGKTRLTEELVEWRSGHGDLPAVAACYRGGVISYAPVTAWLRTPGVEAARAGLPDLWLGEVGRIVPELLADRPDVTPRPITEDWQRQHLFEALARALVAPGHPLIPVLEDLHWCDHAKACAALEAWRGTATVFAVEWMALWPLSQLALARGDVGEAVAFAAGMLDEKQQRLPDPHAAALDAAVQAWRGGSPASARRHLTVALALARSTGHL
jgi:AAA ATPase domain